MKNRGKRIGTSAKLPPYLKYVDPKALIGASNFTPAELLALAQIYDSWARQIRRAVSLIDPELRSVSETFSRPEDRSESAKRLRRLAAQLELIDVVQCDVQGMAAVALKLKDPGVQGRN